MRGGSRPWITIVSSSRHFSYRELAPPSILGSARLGMSMKNSEWLREVSKLTGVPYYEQHRIFGDKSGALIGISDGYVVAIGLGKVDGRNAGVKILLRYSKAPDPVQVKQALDPVKGKFKLTTEETTATLLRTYSFTKPDAADIAENLRELLTALKTAASPISGKCEECGKAEQQLTLLNRVPTYYCSSCQVQLTQKLDAEAVAYENLETNLPLGLLYGLAAAVLGSIAWGGVAYLLRRIFLWGAIGIGLLTGKAVVKGTGKVTWTARIMIGLLTAASVAFGDALFYALLVMKENQLAFVPALKLVLMNFWKLESDSDGGLASIFFGLIGAGIAVYGTRKPAFKARFVALGTPATTLSSVAAK
jgi:hypothetical protein